MRAGGAPWTVAAAGDFNGDAISDILWHNVASGQNAIWRSANSATPQSIVTVTNAYWDVAEVGDFNGDGKADVLWRNLASGADSIWLTGNAATAQAVATVADLAWHVVP